MADRTAWLRAFGALALAACAAPAHAEELTARAIVERFDARDDGDNSTQDLEMILVDKRGAQRVRKLRSYEHDVGADEQSMMFFVAPADVKDTGFLTYDYRDPARDDDQWLYLPALSRTKRIASADKSGSFMGSDFSYADMTKRPLDAYRYTLMKDDQIDGQPVWQIESVPITEQEQEETGYTKSVSFVRKDNFVVVRSVAWVKKGDRLKYFEVKKLEQIDGIWVATEMDMSTRKGDETLHRTILTAKNTRFGQKLGDDFFTTRQLEKGP
jgi:Outer membrane lipoprotein-sorting protein